jgi:hypothetical protein
MVLLNKLIVTQLAKKSSALYETYRRVHRSPQLEPNINQIQSKHPQPISFKSILIL